MHRSIVEALRLVAEQRAGAPALRWHSSEWTYRDLLAGTRAISSQLRGLSIHKGARVALLLRNSPHFAAAYYGTLGAGCIVVPLNVHERAVALAAQIAHSTASVILADRSHPEWSALRASLDRSDVKVVELNIQDAPGASAALVAEFTPSGVELAEPSDFQSSDLAAIVYTSGTTGQPKGVMLTHGNLHSNTSAIIQYLGLTSGDRGLSALPFHFSYGCSVLHSHLLSGATLVIEDNLAFPHRTLQRIQDEHITGFAGVPSTYALILNRCRLEDFDLSSLRYLTQAGGAMPRALIEQIRNKILGARFFVMYGQTEATARLSYLPPERLHDKPGSVGIAIPGVELQVRLAGRPSVHGEIGEIYARGPNIMRGYWRDAAATSAVLQDGWLRTGDLGHIDDEGYLYIDGRAVEMIKVGAYRVSPHEVEEVLIELEAVDDVAVTGMDDDTLGQAVKAVIVLKPGAQLEALTVKAHCRAHLAAYKVPKMVQFVSSLPRTCSGKIQRLKLASSAL